MSPRAQYELGRTLIIASDYKPDSPYVARAYTVLERNAAIPDASALADSALILLANQVHHPVKLKWWEQMIRKLCDQPVSEENISALKILDSCERNSNCSSDPADLSEGFACALTHQPVKPNLLAAFEEYTSTTLSNTSTARTAFERVLDEKPYATPVGTRIGLTELLIRIKDHTGALHQLVILDTQPLDNFEIQQMSLLKKSLEDQG